MHDEVVLLPLYQSRKTSDLRKLVFQLQCIRRLGTFQLMLHVFKPDIFRLHNLVTLLICWLPRRLGLQMRCISANLNAWILLGHG